MKLPTILYIVVQVASATFPCGVGLPSLSVNETSVSPDLGAADSLADGTMWDKPLIWPRIGSYHIVYYCYDDVQTYNALREPVSAAIKTWEKALGPPNARNGHSVMFKMATNRRGRPYFCQHRPGRWNKNVLPNTLAIQDKRGVQAHCKATYGGSWRPQSKVKGWKFKMEVGWDYTVNFLVHEFGHVLGMAHEHQRPDRDKYIKFNCKNLWGFKEALDQAQKRVTPTQLCTDPEVAHSYGLNIIDAYVKAQPDPEKPHYMKPFGAYDVNSVMHYKSNEGQRPQDCLRPGVETCVLEIYKDPNNHRKGTFAIMGEDTITKKDKEWVKAHYPFKKKAAQATVLSEEEAMMEAEILRILEENYTEV